MCTYNNDDNNKCKSTLSATLIALYLLHQRVSHCLQAEWLNVWVSTNPYLKWDSIIFGFLSGSFLPPKNLFKEMYFLLTLLSLDLAVGAASFMKVAEVFKTYDQDKRPDMRHDVEEGMWQLFKIKLSSESDINKTDIT